MSVVMIALITGMMLVTVGCGPKDKQTEKTGDGEQAGPKGQGNDPVKNPVKDPVKKPKAKRITLNIKLPDPMFKGTPVPMNEENIAAPRPKGQGRPPIRVPEGTTNLALGKTVTSNEPLPVVGELKMVTDGEKSGEDGHNVDIGFGKKYVTIDLGSKATISGVSVWHYHGQARAYRDVIIEVADDVDFIENVQILFNSDHNNSYGKGAGTDKGYIETNEGRYMYAPKGTAGRYVRLHSQGNTANDQNHYIEVEVYGIPVK
ncbi:MAG: hypothetical protein GY794_10600 [bacterium]|nr:hypothetical protein [bacterium]